MHKNGHSSYRPDIPMTSPLSNIGFKIFSAQDTIALAQLVMANGRKIGCAEGNYMAYTTKTGSQLWARLDANNQCRALNAHFVGKTQSKVLLTQRVKFNNSPLDGRFFGWVNPDPNARADADKLGDYPILFEAPDYAYYHFMELPCEVTVQLTAFPKDLKVFLSEEEFKNFPARTWPKEVVSTQIVHSSSTGNAPEAFISAVVLETEVLENPITHFYFQWAKVKVGGGYFDIVADTKILEVAMQPGAIISGNFIISGQLSFNH